MLNSIDEIVNDLYENLYIHKRNFLKTIRHEDLVDLQCTLGKVIRIRYNLTSTNPLVRSWFTNPENHVMIDNTDVSENHPYNLSLKIMQELWKRIQNELAS